MKTPVYTIEKAWRMNSLGFDVHDGYDLFVDGNWGNRYALKRDAKFAMLEAIEQDKKLEKEIKHA